MSLLVAVALTAGAACAPPDQLATAPSENRRLSVAASLGGSNTADLEGFARALEPRTLVFPEDHGPHPAFKTEWWYWIGNLTTGDGRRFGYQLTFFRSALAPPLLNETPATDAVPSSPEETSDWSTRQVYMAHLALTDIEEAAFHSFERFSRGAVALAGARADPFQIWLDDWSVAERGPRKEWFVRAAEGEVELELTLEPGKPRVLHGNRGLSRKGAAPGAASYYYSRSRMPTRGRLTVGGAVFEVEGSSWFDREWSTSLLAADEVGWDWLGAQLEDGRELMLFRLRRRDGSSARIDGTIVEGDGSSRELRTQGVELSPLGAWTSPKTGVTYPAGFRIELPAEALSLVVTPLVSDQELRLSFVYWEGAVSVAGSVAGRGYLEMTGYGELASPR